MAMTKCGECGAQISTTANACPQCGAKVPRPKLWLWVPLGIVFGVFVLALVFAPSEREIVARESRELCRKMGYTPDQCERAADDIRSGRTPR